MKNERNEEIKEFRYGTSRMMILKVGHKYRLSNRFTHVMITDPFIWDWCDDPEFYSTNCRDARKNAYLLLKQEKK